MFKFLETGKKKENNVPFYDTFSRDSPTPTGNRLIAFPKKPSLSRIRA